MDNYNNFSTPYQTTYYNEGNSYRGSRGYGSSYSRKNRNYSYNDSKAHMIEKLDNLMGEATEQKDKDAIQRLIDQMQNN